jgi:hypothetical protein
MLAVCAVKGRGTQHGTSSASLTALSAAPVLFSNMMQHQPASQPVFNLLASHAAGGFLL